jgi:farnesyl diphosphate synthase
MSNTGTGQLGFTQWMGACGSRIEQALNQALPLPTVLPEKLHEAMRYAVLQGGKRVRPMLVYAAGHALGANLVVLDAAAAALEMIHAYSLVHDDMPAMDNDVLRRGKPTVHVAFGEAQALLVGDALQTQAFETLSHSALTPLIAAGQLLAMVQTLAVASGSLGMAGGQAIDLLSVGKVGMGRPALELMHSMKTGALLRASVRMGALSGNATPEQLSVLDVYASALGLAFQVIDDVLDVESDTATLGKTAGKDADNDKPTFVSLMGLAPAKALAANLRDEALAALARLPNVVASSLQPLQGLADLIVLRKM